MSKTTIGDHTPFSSVRSFTYLRACVQSTVRPELVEGRASYSRRGSTATVFNVKGFE
jgi:hypothetical protein